MTTPEAGRPLDEIVLGLGAAYGYSGDDLTNPRNAALRGELPYLPGGTTDSHARPLELRVHGVGGAPPADNLETPNTLQVAGDGSAGFFRPWHPGGTPHPDEPRREAYCWGKLNVGSWTRALWLLLVAFMIVNVAHFALPRVGKDRVSRAGDALCRALLRLLALAITLAFIGTTITVVADLAAWQAPRRGALPSWLRWFGELNTGPRLCLALVVTLAVLLGMAWLSRTTAASYESWDAGTFAAEDPRWPLTSRRFWCGERTVSRQRYCHVTAGAAEVVFIAAMPHSSAHGLRVVLVIVAAVLIALAVVLTVSPWTDRQHVAGRAARRGDTAMRWTAAGAVAAGLVAAVSRLWWQPNDRAHALPGSQPLQTSVVFAIFALLGLLALVLLFLRPWRQADVMGNGWAAVLLATLASMLATIFGAAFTLTIANLLGRPRVTFCGRKCGGGLLYLPSTVFAGGLGMIAALGLVVLFAVFALAVYRTRLARVYRADGPDSVLANYPEPGGPQSVRTVAKTWAGSKLTDLAAPALAVIAIPTALVALAYQSWLAITDQPGARWLQNVAAFGGTVGVVAIGYFLLQLRSALVAAQKRKRFGFIWDVGTFFPRACAPFGPPSYAERSVPEIVTRIRRIVGDRIRDADDPALAMQRAERADGHPDDPREAHSRVLLVGYSQGTPISVAVVAQLPLDVVDRTALLTLAAPVRRLYGRTFPGYFGPPELAVLRERIGARWCNLVRRSDYIGGWVVQPPGPGASVDVEIHDPPVLWSDHDPSPPPTHRHSDWFPDPQTRPYADALVDLGVGSERGTRHDGDDQRGHEDQRG